MIDSGMVSSVIPSVILVPLLPWLAAAWIGVRRLAGGPPGESWEKTTGRVSGAANLLALGLLLALDVQALLQGAPGPVRLGEWFASGPWRVPIGFHLDPLSLALATLMALIGFLALRFSVNYMHREAGFQRFFLGMNLFTGAMLLILLAGNAVLAFVGWEVAGFSSWMLIGYALDRPIATGNANRAFITNRIGDAGFLAAIYFCQVTFGGLDWDLLHGPAVQGGPLNIGLVAIGFTVAALAKSGQVPFSPWIARALDGPTPSSALFYGAVMVHAGVYLMIRLEPLLVQVPWLLILIAGIGALTSIYGFLGGLVLSDVKSSLMFSTTAQVGLMFVLCGLGWFEAAAWYLGLHTCFRAFQFLHAPALMAMAGRGARPVPGWLLRQRWLYSAALQRFWLEQAGDALLASSTLRMATDADALEHLVIHPLLGLPAQASAIASLAVREGSPANALDMPLSAVGQGRGLVGSLIQAVASLLHQFEERMVLQGGGEGMMDGLRKLGRRLVRIDDILSQPRYLMFMIFITLVIIL
ncbi:MAG: hypothetical protein HQL82_04525 [Magnetococcales bacterium]|nr:hypothetical protein [Magnetococcales bacterium]